MPNKYANQISFEDLIESELQLNIRPITIGLTIYRVCLDVIEEGVIDHYWSREKSYGYSALRPDLPNKCYITFMHEELGDTVFTNYDDAKSLAVKNSVKYTVMRGSELKSKLTYFYNNNNELSEKECYICILENNMILYKKPFMYRFLEVFCSEKELTHRHAKLQKEYDKDKLSLSHTSKDFLIKKDIYLTQNGKWSDYAYAAHNGAVQIN